MDLCRQKSRNPRRCQRRTVSGWTRATARRQRGSRRAASRRRSRSTGVSLGRGVRRRSTTSWCRSRAFSTRSSRRSANSVDQRRRHLRERRERPPDCGGPVPDAAQDPVEEIDHETSSARAGDEPKPTAPRYHVRRMGRVASTAPFLDSGAWGASLSAKRELAERSCVRGTEGDARFLDGGSLGGRNRSRWAARLVGPSVRHQAKALPPSRTGVKLKPGQREPGGGIGAVDVEGPPIDRPCPANPGAVQIGHVVHGCLTAAPRTQHGALRASPCSASSTCPHVVWTQDRTQRP